MRSLLDFAPPLPPPPPLQTPAPPTPSYNPSIIIITATLFFVVIVSAAVHFLLRFLSRGSSSSPELPLSSTSSPPSTPSPHPLSAAKDPISTLPLFSLAAALPKTSADCAVCLSAFRPHDELRLLPACRHAFHATCIDTWLRSTSSCPLCRAAVVLPFPQPSTPPEAASASLSTSASASSSRSGSFRIEIGSISRRQSLPEADPAAAPPDRRSYSVGSSFEYVVEEEVEAFLNRVLRRVPEKERKPEPPPQPEAAAAALAEAVGSVSRGWLRDYVDRISSSSFRRSNRSSQRYDDGGGGGVAADGGGEWGFEGEESGMFSNFSRWLWGPHPNT